jgi:DNA-binding NarL/FixJ family response regulator
MRILIACTNEEQVGEILAEIHRVAPDWQASECCSVPALKKLLTQDHYDVVVCNLEMLPTPALQQLQRITALASDTYFIALASRDSQLLGARALSAGGA